MLSQKNEETGRDEISAVVLVDDKNQTGWQRAHDYRLWHVSPRGETFTCKAATATDQTTRRLLVYIGTHRPHLFILLLRGN